MNLGYFYFKGMYKSLDSEDFLDLISGDDRKINRVNEKFKNIAKNFLNELNKEIKIENEKVSLSQYELVEFTLSTKEPGFLIGTGYHHEIPRLKEQFINGFEFDYTTGLPKIPGSSIKGAIRDVFPLSDEEIDEKLKKLSKDEKFVVKELNEGRKEETISLLKNLFNKQYSLDDVLALRDKIFNNSDIFLDAEIIDNKNIFKEEFFTPHKSKFENPVPLKFLTIKGGVKFRFRFLLLKNLDVFLSVNERARFYKQIILLNGLGAKTNLNYGRFDEVKTEGTDN